jgi:pre-mRNA cleavage complex 2 protein Pcf11
MTIANQLQDWINTRETVDEDRVASTGNTSSATGASAKATQRQYIPVPSDPVLKNLPCPICQENFTQIYLDDAGDWVWEDAINVGGRVYHASCHQEVIGGSATAMYARSTPEPVLGKRKAEVSLLKTIHARRWRQYHQVRTNARSSRMN